MFGVCGSWMMSGCVCVVSLLRNVLIDEIFVKLCRCVLFRCSLVVVCGLCSSRIVSSVIVWFGMLSMWFMLCLKCGMWLLLFFIMRFRCFSLLSVVVILFLFMFIIGVCVVFWL